MSNLCKISQRNYSKFFIWRLENMNDYKYIIIRIDKINYFTPQACNDMTYKDLFEANRECQYYNKKNKNEDFEYKVFELKEIMGD